MEMTGRIMEMTKAMMATEMVNTWESVSRTLKSYGF